MSLEIYRADVADLEGIVEVHLDRFSDFFLSKLGKRFLRNYYSAFQGYNGIGFLLVAKEFAQVTGFAAVSYESKGAIKNVIQMKFWPIFFSLIPIALKSPNLLVGLLKRFITGKGIVVPGPELLSIATIPNKSGIGSILLKEAEKALKEAGYNSVSLTTDKVNNESTIKFYDRNGYVSLGEFETNEKRLMLRMQKTI